ncbi:hypothetical protein A6P54_13890 [Bacillus sp. MKU004]|nr:hypothetical protein A6P54_13890 [Bacillus sp. MKU004]
MSAGQGIEVRFGIVVEWPCPGVRVWLFCIGMGMEFEVGDWGTQNTTLQLQYGIGEWHSEGRKFVDF